MTCLIHRQNRYFNKPISLIEMSTFIRETFRSYQSSRNKINTSVTKQVWKVHGRYKDRTTCRMFRTLVTDGYYVKITINNTTSQAIALDSCVEKTPICKGIQILWRIYHRDGDSGTHIRQPGKLTVYGVRRVDIAMPWCCFIFRVLSLQACNALIDSWNWRR